VSCSNSEYGTHRCIRCDSEIARLVARAQRADRLVALLRSDAMDRVLDHARDDAETQAPEHERHAENPSTYYRAHHARLAARCHDEINAIDELRALLAESESSPNPVAIPSESEEP
jgi:hypothetical protein